MPAVLASKNKTGSSSLVGSLFERLLGLALGDDKTLGDDKKEF
jgi:hypothetical protein